ncbi:hypothetical protein M413DRAFT_14886 [Hebeloma cylindrosporum]|uniref:Uncharacterized protein n=1 Tax=Hebeloma cylindrosporum TaxID=76867 RepID=A0A0C2X9X6_HEBCY|nr:hypothetical protein M413DRAFT_14886 [Hebeloma cylindrosporum h7]
MIVVALRLPRLIKTVGAWARVEREQGDDFYQIAVLKSRLKDAQHEAKLVKMCIKALEALPTLPSDASQDERLPWGQKLSLMTEGVINELGDRFFELETQDLEPPAQLVDPMLRQHLLLAYSEFIKDLNSLAIVVCGIDGVHKEESSALILQISMEVCISRLQKLNTALEEAAKRAKVDVNTLHVQVKVVGLD